MKYIGADVSILGKSVRPAVQFPVEACMCSVTLGKLPFLETEKNRVNIVPMQQMIYLLNEQSTVPVWVPAWTNASRFHFIASCHLLISFPRGSPICADEFNDLICLLPGQGLKCSVSGKKKKVFSLPRLSCVLADSFLISGFFFSFSHWFFTQPPFPPFLVPFFFLLSFPPFLSPSILKPCNNFKRRVE